jgi:hypothetical protein
MWCVPYSFHSCGLVWSCNASTYVAVSEGNSRRHSKDSEVHAAVFALVQHPLQKACVCSLYFGVADGCQCDSVLTCACLTNRSPSERRP